MTRAARFAGSALFLLVNACGAGREHTSNESAPLAELMDPTTCATCHVDHYREWSGSMHAYAADDPVFRAMNQRGQRETKGDLGAFCVNCHAPLAVRDGATTDGLNLDSVESRLKGVTCFFCHSVRDVDGTHNNPLRLADDRVMRGAYADPESNGVHRSVYSPLHDRGRASSAELCGACHDVVVQGPTAIERTFAEWKETVFSGSRGATCGQCHMEQSRELRPIAVDGPLRRSHAHSMPGIDRALGAFPELEEQAAAVQSQLNRTLQSALCVSDIGGASTISVIVDNVGAGHGFPSGATHDRRVWFEVIAYQGDRVIYESGVVPDGEAAVAVPDPDLWLLRDCLYGGDGNEVHMFWEAKSYRSNQLPAPGTTNPLEPGFSRSHAIQSYPRAHSLLPGTPDRVTLRVLVEPIGLDVLDDLIASGDLALEARTAMPRMAIDLGAGTQLEWTRETANRSYVDASGVRASCISRSNLDPASGKVQAPRSSRCAPP